MTIIPNESEKDYAIIKCFEKFIARFKINHLLRKVNATKEKGFPTYGIFAFLLVLVFTGKNFYTALATEKEKVPFEKDTVYRFLKNANINWNMFIFSLSIAVVSSEFSASRKTASPPLFAGFSEVDILNFGRQENRHNNR